MKMNNLEIFKSEEFGEVRTSVENNEPYFMLNDICKVLEINNSSQARTRLNEDGVISNEVIDSLGRKQMALFINESNLYKLIFQSRKPQAEKFGDWVTSEVLPSIRKHGGYIAANEEDTDEDIMARALIIAQEKIKQREQENKRLENEIQENKPKVLFAEAVDTANDSILVGQLAKLIKQNGVEIGQNRLFTWLRENGYLIRQRGENYNLPTQYSLELKLMEVKKRVINNPDGSIRTTATPKVTGKGQIYFINKFLGKREENSNE